MSQSLFEKILNDLVVLDSYFSQKKDDLGLLGFSPHQKPTLALRMLAYGMSADQLDDLTMMSELTILTNPQHFFCNAIINRYGKENLRAPTKEDLEMILHLHEKRVGRGFLVHGMSFNGSGKTVPKHTEEHSIKEKKEWWLLLRKPWLIVDFSSGMHGLECPRANNDLNILDHFHFLS